MSSEAQRDAAFSGLGRVGDRSVQPAPLARSSFNPSDFGDLYWKPLEFFKPNPINQIFQEMKTERYWRELERDIREAGAIRDPLLAMPDGTLLAGESRLVIAKKLAAEGLKGFEKLPARLNTTNLSPDQQKKIVYSDNLSRFEVPEDRRSLMLAEIYPEYFLTEAKRGPRSEEQSSAPTAQELEEEISKRTGLSTRTIQRTKEELKEARALAQDEGQDAPTIEHLKRVHEKAKKKRAKKGPAKMAQRPQGSTRFVEPQLTLKEAREILKALSENPTPMRKQIAAKITKAAKALSR